MSTATLTDKDLRVREDVVEQLDWDPAVDASGIGVSARDGAVTLTGTINTYAGKLAAERAVKHVLGVRAVANDLEVKLVAGRNDTDIAADAATVLRIHDEVPDTVQAAVHHGHITLTGTVDSHFMRVQAEKAVRHIRGVRHLVNRIAVVPRATGRDLRKQIAKAMYRNAALNAKSIVVTETDGVVTLKGAATTWMQRQAAERAAYDVPGIVMVDNQIIVEPPDGKVCEIC